MVCCIVHGYHSSWFAVVSLTDVTRYGVNVAQNPVTQFFTARRDVKDVLNDADVSHNINVVTAVWAFS